LARRLKQSRPAALLAVRLEKAGVKLGGRWALRDVTLEIRRGDRWLLTGPNGAGKTLLLKLLSGDVWPTPNGGERRSYLVGGEWQTQPLLARERIAYLGPERQDRYDRYGLDLNVADVVATGLTGDELLLTPPLPAERRAVHSALLGVGLAGLAARRFLGLSNGQRRRVLLARALVRRPDLLLLDEALNGLDAASRHAFLRTLRQLADGQTAWVLSTHRPTERPDGITHVACVEHGHLQVRRPAVAGLGSRKPQADSAAVRKRAPRSDVPATEARGKGQPLLRLERVSVFRGGRRVIGGLDWTIDEGEQWRIVGPNGSGKSTLIALLYGDLAPADGGRIARSGHAIGQPIEEWKHRVGIVSPDLQSVYAATACTLEEIVLSGLHSSIGLNDPPGAADRARARRWLARLDLQGLGARPARAVSYGQLRRALVARALVRRRRLLLLDEPFDGLDADARRCISERLRIAVSQGTQLVVATHHQEDLPRCVSRELVLPDRGPRRR
jgi:molybdate transport system ATP-binding protein